MDKKNERIKVKDALKWSALKMLQRVDRLLMTVKVRENRCALKTSHRQQNNTSTFTLIHLAEAVYTLHTHTTQTNMQSHPHKLSSRCLNKTG